MEILHKNRIFKLNKQDWQDELKIKMLKMYR